MLKAVLETDVIVASILSSRGNKYLLRKAWEAREFQLTLSVPILEEVTKTLNHRSLRKEYNLADQDIWGIEDILRRYAIIVSVNAKARAKIDIENKFVVCAQAVGAGYIVRDDRRSKELNYIGGIRIMNPGGFLKLLERRRRIIGLQKIKEMNRGN